MKGQISLEYIVSLAVFIAFVGYFFYKLIVTVPVYLGEVRREGLRSEVYSISELLINNPGEPSNWAGLPWWNFSWPYRIPIILKNFGGDATNRPISFSLNTEKLISEKKMKEDCADIRVVNQTNALIPPPYSISDCNSQNTLISVIVPFVPSENSTIYMYYGNLGA